jgi:UDP-N-acetylglucosamine 2-epimerase (non-hydrolysing)
MSTVSARMHTDPSAPSLEQASRRGRGPGRPVHIMVAFGTRPEALKLYPVIALLRKSSPEFRVTVLATAQHRGMLDQVLRVLSIRTHYDLNIMTSGQSLSEIMIQTLRRLSPILETERPDMVLVQGDTSTTLSVSLAAFHLGIPLGHVEAGLRTRDRSNPFPEEINRQLTSVLATLHFAPTLQARENLLVESIPAHSIFVTGNTIVDSLKLASGRLARARPLPFLAQHKSKLVILVTAHRRENFGAPLEQICRAIARLADTGRYAIVFPVHPNPQVRRTVKAMLQGHENLFLCEPLDYRVFLKTLLSSSLVITDSGGVQEEAVALGVTTLVTRTKTERPEGIVAGIAQLVGVGTENIIEAANRAPAKRSPGKRRRSGSRVYGDGLAARRVIEALRFHWGFRRRRPADYCP